MKLQRKDVLAAIMGVVVGDATGCPYEFSEREEMDEKPATDMVGYGTFNMPPGTWTDDSSMTLALLASLREKGKIDPEDIMNRFDRWLSAGEYTPFGRAFDVGVATETAIKKYRKDRDVKTCGGTSEYDNGNGSLMRIMPACLYCVDRDLSEKDAVKILDQVGGLTHNHLRTKIACGLYYFCVKEILGSDGTLIERLQRGLDHGFAFYENAGADPRELKHFDRIRDLKKLSKIGREDILSGGYVIETIEAVMWSLVKSGNYRETVLCAVNLSHDTDTVAAIAGGLAGLFYGYDDIPKDWIEKIQRREWIESLCG